MIAMVWVLSAIICFPPLAGWKCPQPTTPEGYPLCVLSEQIGYVVYSTLGSFYIPLLVMVVVYFKIYLAARERARKNLKKKKQTPLVTNTTSVTCTSVTKVSGKQKPTVKVIKEEPDNSSDLEDEPEPLSHIPETGKTTNPGLESGDTRMNVTNHNVYSMSGTGEKHKLISENTDTDGGPVCADASK